MTDFLQDHPDGQVLALDEMSLYFQGLDYRQVQATLTRVWSLVGHTPIVKVHPGRECCHFYGALNLCNGREVALPVQETTSAMTANFVMLLLLLFPQPILLLLDRAPWHFGDHMRQLLAQTDRLQILFFPPACPDLNPQEHVWERTRDAISHNHAYRQFQPLVDAFEDYLNETFFPSNFMDTFLPLGLGIF